MDPISQATLGAACAQATQRAQLGWLAFFGIVAGMAPDLDVLISSRSDPLLFLVYHRQFSHSLLFIPFGALLITLVLFWLPKQPLPFARAYLASFAGYATHGLLDACTSYGTQLLWPFSDVRISWNLISVIDPLFTLPLLATVVLALKKQRRLLATAGLGWAFTYLGIGFWQQLRVTDAAETLARTRQHQPERLLVKPAFGNLVLWKSVYAHEGHFFVDGHHAAGDVSHCGGERIAELELARDFRELPPQHQQARDIERFRWFSTGYIARLDSGLESLVIDVRYANLPNRIAPLWGIVVDPAAPLDQHAAWWANRKLSPAQRAEFGSLLKGRSCRPTQLATRPPAAAEAE
ncbi:MAG: metal-dependent hydrolase [Pseudomonadota bacterium]